MSTKAELTRLHTLIGKLHIDEDAKRAMIAGATNGRTTSSREMTSQEIEGLCNGLASTALSQQGDIKDSRDVMRKKIISRGYKLGWTLPNGKIDMEAVNTWCIDYGHMHVPLNDYKYDELVKLVGQMDATYKSYLKAV